MTVFAYDPDLLRRFRSGERAALSTVYWFYIARVEHVVRRGLRMAGTSVFGPRSADVSDLVQDVFIRAYAESARLAYDGKRPYAPFLMTIARNALIDHVRRLGRERQLEPSQLERLVEQGGTEDTDIEPWADPPTMALVERYIAGLSAQERAVYVERYCSNRSQEQSAQALGLTRQQVRTLEARVRSGLVRELARAKLAFSAPLGNAMQASDERH